MNLYAHDHSYLRTEYARNKVIEEYQKDEKPEKQQGEKKEEPEKLTKP